MSKQLMPRAQLEPRDGDIRLTDDEFLQLSLFAQLKRKPSLDKFPGAMVLRHYRKGELIFRQGEAGWTAFYILTSEDILALRKRQLEVGVREGERKPLGRRRLQRNIWAVVLDLVAGPIWRKFLPDERCEIGAAPAGIGQERMRSRQRFDAPFDRLHIFLHAFGAGQPDN